MQIDSKTSHSIKRNSPTNLNFLINTYVNTKKVWAITIKTGLEPLSEPRVFGYARWRKDWAKVQ